MFELMLKSGLESISLNEAKVNSINVFPVPDGDTGSNMRLTLENGVKHARSSKHLGEYLKSVADGMLLGARGNSGVILSQLFNGLSIYLRDKSYCHSKELVKGFISAYKKAYESVINPVEGTLLTVSREGIEKIKDKISRATYIDNFFNRYIFEMKKTLAFTPELLPKLKEAGVVDSGGMGYIIIIEGFLKFFNDGYSDFLEDTKTETPTVDFSLFNEQSEFELGYCTEFILQLLNNKTNINKFDKDIFIEKLGEFGDSLVVVESGSKVKVHVHTKTPGKVIEYAQTFGEFITFKIENMQLQNNEFKKNKPMEHKLLGKIAITNGESLKNIYKELGCDIVLDGGKTMNTSSEEILNALKNINADYTVVFPNNKNIELACSQAISALNKKNISMISTKNVLEGYYALASDEPDNNNIPYRLSIMNDAKEVIDTISFFKSIRSCTLNQISVTENDYVSIRKDVVLSSNTSLIDSLCNALKKVDDISSKSNCILLKGKDFNLDEDSLINTLSSFYPDIEFNFLDGGQQIFDLIDVFEK